MIVLDIAAGLGNQMFIYAFGRALSLKRNDRLVLDIHAFKYDEKRKYGLKNLSLPEDIFLLDDIGIRKYIIKSKKILFDIIIKILKINRNDVKNVKILEKMGYFSTGLLNYIEITENKCLFNYYSAMFQSEKYFKEFKSIICKELKVSAPIDDKNKKMIDQIKNDNSVCVHIRRGDYLKSEMHNLCNEDYYKKAIDLMSKKINNPKFYFFSDDINWVKSKFTNSNYVIVDINNKDYEDLRLMYSCKNFIIPNSTFSWWAQYLSDNDQKYVIAPNKWFKDKPKEIIDIYMENWITIEVE